MCQPDTVRWYEQTHVSSCGDNTSVHVTLLVCTSDYWWLVSVHNATDGNGRDDINFWYAEEPTFQPAESCLAAFHLDDLELVILL